MTFTHSALSLIYAILCKLVLYSINKPFADGNEAIYLSTFPLRIQFKNNRDFLPAVEKWRGDKLIYN